MPDVYCHKVVADTYELNFKRDRIASMLGGSAWHHIKRHEMPCNGLLPMA